jgi:prefoldin subunit 5
MHLFSWVSQQVGQGVYIEKNIKKNLHRIKKRRNIAKK